MNTTDRPRVRRGVLHGVPCHKPEPHKAHPYTRGDQAARCDGKR